MTLKCCGGWCSSFVCDIETDNRMYQNKIQFSLMCERNIPSLTYFRLYSAEQNYMNDKKILWQTVLC